MQTQRHYLMKELDHSHTTALWFVCRYAFLIDEKGLVRWRGSGKAKQTEVAALLKAADQLLHPKK